MPETETGQLNTIYEYKQLHMNAYINWGLYLFNFWDYTIVSIVMEQKMKDSLVRGLWIFRPRILVDQRYL